MVTRQTTYFSIQLFTLLALVLAVTGCKLRITVPEGGRVVWGDGTYQCEQGQTCDVDVVDFFFAETFLAEPMEGYYLRYWDGGDRRFCGKNPTPSCHFDISGFRGYGVLESYLESDDEIFYLQPRFDKGNCKKKTYDDNLWWLVENMYHFQEFIFDEYLECNIPGVAAPVKHGLYLSYSTGNDTIQYHEGLICVSTYDLGTLIDQTEYSYFIYTLVQPYVTKHLRVWSNGTSEVIHYDGVHGETGREIFLTPVMAC